MENDAENVKDDQESERKRSWFERWIHKLFSDDRNWEYLSQGCINYPYCYF
jgi:hypothetical protein